jgi:hypothetical protein
MNYGASANALLLTLKRSDWLPPYGEELIRSIFVECGDHVKEMRKLQDIHLAQIELERRRNEEAGEEADVRPEELSEGLRLKLKLHELVSGLQPKPEPGRVVHYH